MEQAVQTEVVLETLFRCVSFQQLKELRLICKYWNKLASTELRKRSEPILIDQDQTPKSLKKLYNLELCMKNKDITAKLPIAVYIGRNSKNDWRILKDIATYDAWRSRVLILELSGFLAPDLNRLIPFLLDQLPLVSHLGLNKNMIINVGKSIIPEDFKIPQVSSSNKFSLKSLHIAFPNVNCAGYEALDPRFLRQCPYVKEFAALVMLDSNEAVGFFERLNKLHSGDDFIASFDYLLLSIRPGTVEQTGPLATLAQFVNNTKPGSLDLTDCSDNFNLVYFLTLLQVELRTFSINVLSSEGTMCYSNWLINTLKKFKIFSQLKELGLKPNSGESDHVPEEVERDVKHNLDKVTTLKIGCDSPSPFVDKFKCLLEDAAHHLRNVTRLELLNVCFITAPNLPIWALSFNSKPIFEGIRQFNGLREIFCDIKDLRGELGTAWVENAMIGCSGLLEPLSLLSGSRVQKFTLNVNVAYSFNVEMVLLALFKGYEPKVQLNLNLKTKGCGRKKYRYSKEELKKTLDKICNGSR